MDTLRSERAAQARAFRCRTEIPFAAVLRWLGFDCPDVSAGRSVKVDCPFGFLHADGGAEPAFRVYGAANDAWCFACTRYFDTVGLVRAVCDCGQDEAVDRLAGWWWPEAEPVETGFGLAAPAPTVSTAALVEALRVYCSRQPGWVELEWRPDVLAAFTAAASVLERVTPGDDAAVWLTRCKRYMDEVLASVPAPVEG